MNFTTSSKRVKVRGSIPQTEDILLLVDFHEKPYLEEIWGSGGAFRAYISPLWYRSNEPVCQIATDIESPADGDYAYIGTWFPLASSKNCRVVCLWRRATTAVDYIRFRCRHYDGSYFYDACVRYAPSSGVWEYYDENGSWQTIGSQKLRIHARHLLEFSVDFNTGKYKKLVSAGEEFDLSAYCMYKAPSTSDLATNLEIHVYSDGTGCAEADIFWIYITEG